MIPLPHNDYETFALAYHDSMNPVLGSYGYFKHGEETEWRFILYQGGICK